MNPYEKQPPKAFWKHGVANNSLFDISGLWNPKFRIMPKDNISAYGSCFSQYFGKTLEERGYSWLRTEAAPFGMNPKNQKLYGYNIFSSRTANIYTSSLLRQWTDWALNPSDIPDIVWKKGDHYIDPFRPKIEPNGFESVAELENARKVTCKSFKESISKARYFIFTLGLTERWLDKKHGFEYPMCPGTAGGKFSSEDHEFSNMDFGETLKGLRLAISNMREINPRLKFILTVSPVPLTATATNQHVLVATMHSKSLLRAVAGQLALNNKNIDYFPSYEIINSPAFRGTFFEPNLRSVNPYGVQFVMNSFFNAQEQKFGKATIQKPEKQKVISDISNEDVICEEELLNAFGNQK